MSLLNTFSRAAPSMKEHVLQKALLTWNGSSSWKWSNWTVQSSSRGRSMSQSLPFTSANADRSMWASDRSAKRNVFLEEGFLEIRHELWLTFSYVWRRWDAFVENERDVLWRTFVVDPYLFQPGDEVSLSLLLLLKHTAPFCSHGLVWGASGQLGVARYQSCNNL